MESESKHFSHEHELTLNKVQQLDDGETERAVCYACLEPIAEQAFFSCDDCDDFFLHQTCANLSKEMEGPVHPPHPLILLATRHCHCDVCGRRDWERFTYNCALCFFDVCVACALEGKIKHHHALIPYNQVKENDTGGEEVVCGGCNKPITDDDAYSCSDCNFFLHKTCAELPEVINNVSHPMHPLSLFGKPPYPESFIRCDCCHETWRWFTYNCATCDFDVCVECALVPKIKHHGHDHPLIPYNQVKKNYNSSEKVVCGGCNKPITDDDAYSCSDCNFFLHKTCAELPETYPIKLSTSLTPNTLLPSYFNKIRLVVSFFARAVEELGCGSSTIVSFTTRFLFRLQLFLLRREARAATLQVYFAHVQCARLELKSISGEQSEIKVGETFKVMKFPVPDEFMNQISYFLQVLNTGEIQKATELAHVSHPHPLILCDVQAGYICISKDDLLVCNGCAQLIVASNSYYRCSQISCDFFLHTICTELPDEVQHPCHPQHPLSFHPKSTAESISLFSCDLCTTYCNGFRYRCELCNFDLDLRCASVPDTIEHEAHRHPLVPAASGVHCSACRKYCGHVTYGCDNCGFYLAAFCAMFPRTATHYYDAHPLSLVYPPFPDHPDEFYCEMCQDEIAPNLWLYHCRDCNQSFHPRCLLPGHWCSNMKSGGTYAVEKNIHEHPKLKLQKILQGERISKWSCSLCGTGAPAVLACTECDFPMCLTCLMKYPSSDVQWSTSGLDSFVFSLSLFSSDM
ncbi:hypothetical protein RJ640_010693 [Escallonia rubra]|uniref:Phorbol-ester/DAG-type domain-containing protein n=1 Tax=Escallonia rubra TaxID=112253 RepID=A0AA88UQU5_9ASTE|nr:hypothetical protein RJ640_010693 [Escallonia rubra]